MNQVTVKPHGSALTPQEVGKLLAVDERKVWAWIRSRRLVAMNVTPNGKRATYRIRPVELELFQKTLLTVPPSEVRRRRDRVAGVTSVAVVDFGD